jgi:hypothetical protein
MDQTVGQAQRLGLPGFIEHHLAVGACQRR